jgi:ribosomal protein L29
MKKKDIQNLQTMKSPELTKVIRETQAKLAEYLINRYSKQSKNVREGSNYRKKIAVASTILSQKELSHE